MILADYTAEELRELEAAKKRFQEWQALKAKRADSKANADRQREHFRLRPNDDPQRQLI